jgi:hypothetical protein
VTLDRQLTPAAAAEAAAERRARKRRNRIHRLALRLDRRLDRDAQAVLLRRAMLVEIQRMREVGFLHNIGEAQARANYFRRLQARH